MAQYLRGGNSSYAGSSQPSASPAFEQEQEQEKEKEKERAV